MGAGRKERERDTMPEADGAYEIRGIAEARLYPPNEALKAQSPFRDAGEAGEFIEWARRDPDAYWARIASELEWFTSWDTVRQGELPEFRYFVGATSNVSHNCLDRHLKLGRKNKAALLWESEDGRREVWTYQQLHDEVNRLANALKDLGVGRGDVVAIYMGNIPEVFASVHACYRIGALYNIIFAGFSTDAVRQRLEDSRPKTVIVADATSRRGREVPLKRTLDEAAEGIDSIEAVVVVPRAGAEVTLVSGRDHLYPDLLRTASRWCPPEPIEANEPGFIIYTSGTESRPKGVVHSGLGFLVGTYADVKWSMNPQEDDVYWCTADVGWLTFPIWSLVGGLAHGVTMVVYEGALNHPDPGRIYEVAERYRVSKIFTAPTALRMLRGAGERWLEGRDLSALDLVSLVGEPIDPETWHWVHQVVGRGHVFVNNTYGQTETATGWTSALVGISGAKPGSCGQALPGYTAEVVDERGEPVPPGTQGYLTITRPFPCLARTVWGDHQRYLDTYFKRFPGRYFSADACVVDEDGHYWVTGRVDDVINVSGHRLGTMEIEAALLNHPDVAEAAVIGVPDQTKGTVPVAFVLLRAGAEPKEGIEEELERQVVDHVGPIARPAAIHVVSALPKTRSGKIMRRLLRELIVDGRVRGDTTALEDPESVSVLEKELPARRG